MQQVHGIGVLVFNVFDRFRCLYHTAVPEKSFHELANGKGHGDVKLGEGAVAL